MIVRFVLGLYLLSGFTSLVYQVVWTRLLTLTLGSTVYAVSTILAVFMTGLALGSYLAGRTVRRQFRRSQKLYSPLVLYGLLEGAIGLYAFVLPSFLSWAQSGYLAIHAAFQPSFVSSLTVQIMIAACLLLPPTVLMGATFPLMCFPFLRQEEELGRVAGRVYGTNTAGAVLGTIAAGFLLIPIFGVKGTMTAAIIINFLICVSSFLLSRFWVYRYPGSIPSPTVSETLEPSPIDWRIFLALGFSGFAFMAYEVLWTRVLLLVWPSTTYAFSTMLAVILAGLAAGSAIGSRIVNRLKGLTGPLCLVQAGVACSAVVGLAVFAYAHRNAPGTVSLNHAWGTAIARMGIESIFLMAIPAVLAGMVYPFAGRLMAGHKGASHPAGLLYAVGTLGGVLGSVFAGFSLIPWMGLAPALIFTAGINLLSGILFLANREAGSSIRAFLRTSAIGLTAVTAVICLLFVSIFPLRLPMRFASDAAVLYYRDGTDATVAVYREKNTGDLVLQVNSQAMARTNHGAMVEQKLRGHLPLLIHRHPASVLQVGLGAGITVASMAGHPLESLETVEISPKVIEAARLFSDYNRGVLSNTKVTVIENDGRNYLLAGSKKYDVVVSDSQPPWAAGIVNLYTQDYYRLVSSRLNEDGMMSQVVPLYGLSLDQVKNVIRTFQSVFPYTTVWLAYGDLILVGQKKDIPIDLNLVKKRLGIPTVADDLRTIFRDSPSDVLRSFIFGWKTVKAFVGDGPVVTDSHPTLEFTAPKTIHQDLRTDNIFDVNRWREEVTGYLDGVSNADFREIGVAQQADILFVDGQAALTRGNLGEAIANLAKAREMLGDNKDEEVDSMLSLSHFGLAKRYLENGFNGNAKLHIEQALAVSPRFIPARYLLADLLSADNKKEAARAQYEEILKQNPASIQAYLDVGEISEEAGDYKKALEQYQNAVRVRREDPKAYQLMARVHYKQKEYKEAALLLEIAMKKDPNQNTVLYHLAETYEKLDCSKAKNTWIRFLSSAAAAQVDPEQVKEVRTHLSGLADGMKPCSKQ